MGTQATPTQRAQDEALARRIQEDIAAQLADEMTSTTFTPNTPSGRCSQCGSADYEDLFTGDQGYTACCNEPVAWGA